MQLRGPGNSLHIDSNETMSFAAEWDIWGEWRCPFIFNRELEAENIGNRGHGVARALTSPLKWLLRGGFLFCK